MSTANRSSSKENYTLRYRILRMEQGYNNPQSTISTVSLPLRAPPTPFANYATMSSTMHSQSNAKQNKPSSNNDSQRSKPRSLVRSSNHKQVTLNGRIPLTAFAVSGILVKKKTTSQSHIFSTNK